MGPEMGHVQLSKREGRAGGACFFSSRRRHTRYWRDWSQTCALPISIDEAVAHGERRDAPAFELEKLFGGGEQSLTDYKGKVVVLNVWASWCEPCRDESPLLQRWHERISKDGGAVVGVDVQDASDDARKFVREYKLSYPMLR